MKAGGVASISRVNAGDEEPEGDREQAEADPAV